MPIFVGNSTVNTAVANSTITVDQTQSFAYATSNRNSIRPSLNLDFARSQTVDPRITFTRASSATYFNSQGVLTTAATNIPRIDYNPATGTCNGLLIEESRTNCVRNGFGSGGTVSALPTYWSAPANGSVTNGLTLTYVGPVVNQGIPAYRFTITGTATADGVFNFQYEAGGGSLTNLAVSTSFQQSVYVAIASGSRQGTFTHWGQMRDNTSAIVADSQQSFVPTTTMTRFNTSQTTPASGNAPFTVRSAAVLYYYTNGSVQNITFDIGCGQQEIGTFPTSFIATTGATATRAADVASILIGTLFNPNAFTVYTENIMANITPSEYPRILAINNGSSVVNGIQILTTPTSNPPVRLYGVIGSTGSFPESGNSVLLYTANAIVEGALSVSSNNAYIAWNGANPVVNNTVFGTYTPSSFTTLWISAPISITGARTYCGWARKIMLWTQALSNTELQTLTS